VARAKIEVEAAVAPEPEPAAALDVEVDGIGDVRVRGFARYCLARVAPPYFWSAPSSFTGKYHPGWANGPGGLVLHTRVVAHTAGDLCRAFGVERLRRDQIVAAAILHDLFKFGREGPDRCTFTEYRRHDYLTRRWVEEALREAGMSGKLRSEGGKLRRVLEIMEPHLGKWSRSKVGKLDRAQRLLHVADYVSSRPIVSAVEIPATLCEEPW